MNTCHKNKTGGLWPMFSWTMIAVGGLSLAAAYLLFTVRWAEAGYLSGRIWPTLSTPAELALLLSPYLGLIYFKIYAARSFGGRLAFTLAAGMMFLSGLFFAWPGLVHPERGFSDVLVNWWGNLLTVLLLLGPTALYELVENFEGGEINGSARLRPLGALPALGFISVLLGLSFFGRDLWMASGAAALYIHLAGLFISSLSGRRSPAGGLSPADERSPGKPANNQGFQAILPA